MINSVCLVLYLYDKDYGQTIQSYTLWPKDATSGGHALVCVAVYLKTNHHLMVTLCKSRNIFLIGVFTVESRRALSGNRKRGAAWKPTGNSTSCTPAESHSAG